MSSAHQNRLASESSPYLLQHATNPVDWYPWGEEAFQAARQQDLPIFLSIGYAACHWCHVMEHESFEDIETAQILNENFISIKVDREERPDIDNIYMKVCQLMTGRGGWPLTIIMTPEGKPISETLTSAGQRAANLDPTGLVRGAVQTPEFQVAQQSGQEFLQAILRKDTGAAITTQEQQLYGETFLPQPGDSPQVLAMKVQSRQRAIDAIKAGLPPSAIVAQEQALRRNLADGEGVESVTTPNVVKTPDFSKMTDAELEAYIAEQKQITNQLGGM